jgi:hypothetical protein
MLSGWPILRILSSGEGALERGDLLKTKTNQAFYTKYKRQHPDCSHKVSKVYDFPNRSYSKRKKNRQKFFFCLSALFIFS